MKKSEEKNTVLLSGINNIISRNTVEQGFIVDSLNWINVQYPRADRKIRYGTTKDMASNTTTKVTSHNKIATKIFLRGCFS